MLGDGDWRKRPRAGEGDREVNAGLDGAGSQWVETYQFLLKKGCLSLGGEGEADWCYVKKVFLEDKGWVR